MAKFKVCVVEEITVAYPTIEIEADNEDAANEIAEEMRVEGKLGDPLAYGSIEDVHFETYEA